MQSWSLNARIGSQIAHNCSTSQINGSIFGISITSHQAAAAVNTLNGTELGGRPISVREDREDRDIKDYQRENGIERPARPPPRMSNGRGRGRGRGRGDALDRPEISSSKQVVVHGLPWSFTSEQLHELFADCGTIEKAEVIYGRDNRSRVRAVDTQLFPCTHHTPLQGYGTILFAEEADAHNAIEQHNGTDLEGRTLSVKYDQYA